MSHSMKRESVLISAPRRTALKVGLAGALALALSCGVSPAFAAGKPKVGLIMSLEAQARGYRLFHYTPDRLSFRDNRLYASVEPMVLRDVKGDHYELGAPERVDLATMGALPLKSCS